MTSTSDPGASEELPSWFVGQLANSVSAQAARARASGRLDEARALAVEALRGRHIQLARTGRGDGSPSRSRLQKEIGKLEIVIGDPDAGIARIRSGALGHRDAADVLAAAAREALLAGEPVAASMAAAACLRAGRTARDRRWDVPVHHVLRQAARQDPAAVEQVVLEELAHCRTETEKERVAAASGDGIAHSLLRGSLQDEAHLGVTLEQVYRMMGAWGEADAAARGVQEAYLDPAFGAPDEREWRGREADAIRQSRADGDDAAREAAHELLPQNPEHDSISERTVRMFAAVMEASAASDETWCHIGLDEARGLRSALEERLREANLAALPDHDDPSERATTERNAARSASWEATGLYFEAVRSALSGASSKSLSLLVKEGEEILSDPSDASGRLDAVALWGKAVAAAHVHQSLPFRDDVVRSVTRAKLLCTRDTVNVSVDDVRWSFDEVLRSAARRGQFERALAVVDEVASEVPDPLAAARGRGSACDAALDAGLSPEDRSAVLAGAMEAHLAAGFAMGDVVAYQSEEARRRVLELLSGPDGPAVRRHALDRLLAPAFSGEPENECALLEELELLAAFRDTGDAGDLPERATIDGLERALGVRVDAVVERCRELEDDREARHVADAVEEALVRHGFGAPSVACAARRAERLPDGSRDRADADEWVATLGRIVAACDAGPEGLAEIARELGDRGLFDRARTVLSVAVSASPEAVVLLADVPEPEGCTFVAPLEATHVGDLDAELARLLGVDLGDEDLAPASDPRPVAPPSIDVLDDLDADCTGVRDVSGADQLPLEPGMEPTQRHDLPEDGRGLDL